MVTNSAERRIDLNEKWLNAYALPEGVDRELWWDARVTGFGVRIGRRDRTFLIRRRVGRTPKLITIGHFGERDAEGQRWTLVRARKQAEIMLGAMKAGEDPAAERRARRGGPTLRDALELHARNMRKGGGKGGGPCSEKSITMIETEIPRLLGDWMERPIVELTATELDAVCDQIVKDTPAKAGSANAPGKALANRLIAQVSAVWNSADKMHDLPGKNPARRLTAHHLKPKTDRIADGEFPAWHATVQTLTPVRRDLQLLCLFTGARSESARFAQWEDVDWKRGVLHFRRAKGNRPYTVPLGETMIAMLKQRKADNVKAFAAHGGDHGWIFPTITRDKPFRVIPVREPKEWRLDDDGERVKLLPGMHPLRKTYNSVAIEIGIAKHDREALMNHEGQGVNTRHYGFPQNWDHLAEVQAKIESALWSRIKGD